MIYLIFPSCLIIFWIGIFIYELNIKVKGAFREIERLKDKVNEIEKKAERQKYLDPNRWSNGKLKIAEAKPELVPPHLQ